MIKTGEAIPPFPLMLSLHSAQGQLYPFYLLQENGQKVANLFSFPVIFPYKFPTSFVLSSWCLPPCDWTMFFWVIFIFLTPILWGINSVTGRAEEKHIEFWGQSLHPSETGQLHHKPLILCLTFKPFHMTLNRKFNCQHSVQGICHLFNFNNM
jgi:hypothetical protein